MAFWEIVSNRALIHSSRWNFFHNKCSNNKCSKTLWVIDQHWPEVLFLHTDLIKQEWITKLCKYLPRMKLNMCSSELHQKGVPRPLGISTNPNTYLHFSLSPLSTSSWWSSNEYRSSFILVRYLFNFVILRSYLLKTSKRPWQIAKISTC